MELLSLSSWVLPAVLVDGHWKPGIGDPTFMGWFTVTSYALSCMLCLWASRTRPQGMAPIDITKHIMFWTTLAFVMLLLTLNKQLDFQLLLWWTARNAIRDNGWSDYKIIIQYVGSIGVVFIASMGIAYFVWLTRSSLTKDVRRHRLIALSGAVFTITYVAISAVSLHGIDEIMGWRLEDIKLRWILENTGILFVGLGAFSAIRYVRKAVHES